MEAAKRLGCVYCRDGESIRIGDGELKITGGCLNLSFPKEDINAKGNELDEKFKDEKLNRDYVFSCCPFCKTEFPIKN